MRIPSTPMRPTIGGVHSQLTKVINGNIEFGNPQTFGTNQSPQNIQGSWAQVTAPSSPNTDFAVPHKLGYVPTGFDVKNINMAAHVYQGVTPWTKDTIYLKCDQPSAQMTLFVL